MVGCWSTAEKNIAIVYLSTFNLDPLSAEFDVKPTTFAVGTHA